MSDILWKDVIVKLGYLRPWSENPRCSTKAEALKILKSFDDFGQPIPFVISPEKDVYDGHQRLSALLTVNGEKYKVAARMSSRPLTEEERKKLVIMLHAGATGSWDWEKLSSWDSQDLMSWGLDAEKEIDWKRDFKQLDQLIEKAENRAPYVREIKSPAYLPSNEKPKVNQLFDFTKTEKLLKNIEAADIPEEEKKFLRLAAMRHTVFFFDRIADYYSSSPAPVQALMEESALVIIDFKKAIALGYIEFTKKIADLVRDEYGDE